MGESHQRQKIWLVGEIYIQLSDGLIFTEDTVEIRVFMQ